MNELTHCVISLRMNVSVFDYDNPRLFLSDLYESKKEVAPKLSIRKWSTQIGFRSHSLLSMILTGNRQMNIRHALTISQHLNMTANEQIYFQSLVQLQHTQSPEDKDKILNMLHKLEGTKQSQLRKLEVTQSKILSNPLHYIILALIQTKNFSPDPSWIKNKIRLKYTSMEIRNAIERLVEGKLINQDARGEITLNHDVTTAANDVPNEAVRTLHEKTMLENIKCLNDVSLEQREFQNYFISIKKADLPDIKNKIRAFNESIINEYGNKISDSVYNLSMQLCPYTQGER